LARDAVLPDDFAKNYQSKKRNILDQGMPAEKERLSTIGLLIIVDILVKKGK
jgi:hypothetical protein